MRKNILVFLAIAVLAGVIAVPSWAPPLFDPGPVVDLEGTFTPPITPPEIKTHEMFNLQGRLTSTTPITSPVNITFSIWDSGPIGTGTQLWSETQSVAVDSDGIFNVNLGSVNPIIITFDPASKYYVQINITGLTAPLDPRQRIVSVPIARTARFLVGGTVRAYGNPGVSGITTSTDWYGVGGAGPKRAILGYSTDTSTTLLPAYDVIGTNIVPSGAVAGGALGGSVGVSGYSRYNFGVYGSTLGSSVAGVGGLSITNASGVWGANNAPTTVSGDKAGVLGTSNTGYGVYGVTLGPSKPAVRGESLVPLDDGYVRLRIGVEGKASNLTYARLGLVESTGTGSIRHSYGIWATAMESSGTIATAVRAEGRQVGVDAISSNGTAVQAWGSSTTYPTVVINNRGADGSAHNADDGVALMVQSGRVWINNDHTSLISWEDLNEITMNRASGFISFPSSSVNYKYIKIYNTCVKTGSLIFLNTAGTTADGAPPSCALFDQVDGSFRVRFVGGSSGFNRGKLYFLVIN